MAKIKITNTAYAEPLKGVTAGDTILLQSGKYREPLLLNGLKGTQDRPIIIRPENDTDQKKAVFTSGISFREARTRANKIARRREKSGLYPTVGHLGDQAMLILHNCQFVVIQDLHFEDCWPTAIYMDQCQYIAVDNADIKGGTLAIGANGRDTHDIIVQNCCWQQDKSGTDMWDRIAWGRIHGAKNNSGLSGKSEYTGVDIKNDYRLWDGDFFRAWNIGGNVTITRNTLTDAFNGIHFFNKLDELAPGVDANAFQFNGGRQYSANVLIEKNTFIRIRDNIFEPEDYAWNWVIRDNHIKDCYRPFSFEFKRAGYFYVYNNTACFEKKPSQDLRTIDQKFEKRQTPSLIKPKGPQVNEGPIYMFNNSWYMPVGKGILPKFGLGKLVHKNNAIEFGKENRNRMFGEKGGAESLRPLTVETEKVEEKKRFTRRWSDLQIEMDSDIANDVNFPQCYQYLGYRIGNNSKQVKPGFKNPMQREFAVAAPEARGKALALNIELPDGSQAAIAGGHNIGAVQKKGYYEKVDVLFEFLPDTSWFDEIRPRDNMGTFV